MRKKGTSKKTKKKKAEEIFKKSFGEKLSGTAIGGRIESAGIFKVSDRLFTEISIGYLFASDTIEDISIKLGGLKAGIGIGLKF